MNRSQAEQKLTKEQAPKLIVVTMPWESLLIIVVCLKTKSTLKICSLINSVVSWYLLNTLIYYTKYIYNYQNVIALFQM